MSAPEDTASPAPAILALLRQIDQLYPNRSRASDGIMGDASHQQRKSEHNIGDALDVTDDEANGPPLDKLAIVLLRDPRAWYTIFNRQIRNNKIQDGAARPYSGPNPHTHHMHLSILHERRDDTSPWDLSGLDETSAPQPLDASSAPQPEPVPDAEAAAQTNAEGDSTGALVLSALILVGGVWMGARWLKSAPAPRVFA